MKMCDTGKLETCPPNATCRQVSSSDKDGTCNCDNNFIFNALYSNATDYCLRLKTTTPRSSRIGAQSEGIIEIQRSAAASPPHHHIIGGILIPIFLVFSIVGSAYLVIRYRVVHRIRERFFVNRHHRPSYHDVMMGSDFDPPLI